MACMLRDVVIVALIFFNKAQCFLTELILFGKLPNNIVQLAVGWVMATKWQKPRLIEMSPIAECKLSSIKSGMWPLQKIGYTVSMIRYFDRSRTGGNAFKTLILEIQILEGSKEE